MARDWLTFFLLYCFISAIPAIVLLLRRRGWRPKFYLVSLLVSWTGGGWIIMTVISLTERPGFLPNLGAKNTGKPPA